uniref:60S ribosomal protein L6 n=1 Tax=Steinernema glaseri TaxID=37863 RepID=A0A1I7YKS4_9BILA
MTTAEFDENNTAFALMEPTKRFLSMAPIAKKRRNVSSHYGRNMTLTRYKVKAQEHPYYVRNWACSSQNDPFAKQLSLTLQSTFEKGKATLVLVKRRKHLLMGETPMRSCESLEFPTEIVEMHFL